MGGGGSQREKQTWEAWRESLNSVWLHAPHLLGRAVTDITSSLSKTRFHISRIPGQVALPSLPALLTQPIPLQTQGGWERLEGRLGWPKGALGNRKVHPTDSCESEPDLDSLGVQVAL